jgi:hypothetical protein
MKEPTNMNTPAHYGQALHFARDVMKKAEAGELSQFSVTT